MHTEPGLLQVKKDSGGLGHHPSPALRTGLLLRERRSGPPCLGGPLIYLTSVRIAVLTFLSEPLLLSTARLKARIHPSELRCVSEALAMPKLPARGARKKLWLRLCKRLAISGRMFFDSSTLLERSIRFVDSALGSLLCRPVAAVPGANGAATPSAAHAAVGVAHGGQACLPPHPRLVTGLSERQTECHLSVERKCLLRSKSTRKRKIGPFASRRYM